MHQLVNGTNFSSVSLNKKNVFFQIQTIRAVLKKELELPLIEISDEKARLYGRDILFTGRLQEIYTSVISSNALLPS